MHLNNGLDIPPRNPDILETTIQDILRTYNASMWLAGNAQSADNYVDSVGFAPVTQPNQLVGYVGDGTAQEEAENIYVNSEMIGADGVTPPTGWTGWGTTAGITLAYVGTGVDEFGRYIDARFSGTATVNTFPNIAMAPNLTTPVVEGEVGSMAIPHQIVAGSLAGAGLTAARLQCLTSGGVYVNEAVGAQPTTARALCTLGRVVPATTAYIRPTYQLNALSGNTIDFTVRLWAPRAMRGNLGSYFPTTGAQVFRTRSYVPVYQATTGFKPTLNGGAFNYCAYSKTPASWTPTRLAVIGAKNYNSLGLSAIYQETLSASLQHFTQSGGITALPANTICHYSIHVKIISGSRNIRLQSRKNNGATFPLINVDLDSGICVPVNGAISGMVEKGPDGFDKVTLVWDSGAGSSICVPYVMTDRGNNNDGSAGNTIEIACAFVGVGSSYSGPVPSTSNTPIQSADIVPYSWKFDGVDDRLMVAKPTINPAVDHFRIICYKSPATAPVANSSMMSSCNTTLANPSGARMFINATTFDVYANWRDDAGVANTITATRTNANEKVVATARRSGANVSITSKGDIGASSTASLALTYGAMTLNSELVGAHAPAGGFGQFAGVDIYGIITGNGNPTAGEILALENFLAGHAGFVPLP